MSKYNSCPTCGGKKLGRAALCGVCYQLSRLGGVVDEQCDGSGTMEICGTLVPHVHCVCGEPMLDPAELQRGYCEAWCLAERQGDTLHCPFTKESHGISINHALAKGARHDHFKAQTMTYAHGQEMLSYQVLNDLSWAARQRSEPES